MDLLIISAVMGMRTRHVTKVFNLKLVESQTMITIW